MKEITFIVKGINEDCTNEGIANAFMMGLLSMNPNLEFPMFSVKDFSIPPNFKLDEDVHRKESK